jgi:hypothetical protein
MQAAHPEMTGAIGRASAILKDGRLVPDASGTSAQVLSSKGDDTYTVTTTACPCEARHQAEVVAAREQAEWGDAAQAAKPCKHMSAWKLYLRLTGTVPETVRQEAPSDELPPPAAAREAHSRTRAIPPEHIVYLKDAKGTPTPFVKYTGLLLLAHEEGLQSLTETWTLNEPELSLAQAVATFADGRTCTGCGDSTPTNTRVGGHWRRMALTRAKARALRDALGVDVCSFDEID